jgi:hypothetical protein
MAIQHPMKEFLLLLRERWRWWAIPMAVMLVLTLWLLWTDGPVAIQPFNYGNLDHK